MKCNGTQLGNLQVPAERNVLSLEYLSDSAFQSFVESFNLDAPHVRRISKSRDLSAKFEATFCVSCQLLWSRLYPALAEHVHIRPAGSIDNSEE